MKVVFYSTGCANCHSLAGRLIAKNIPYEACSDVSVMMEKGIMSVPALEVDGVVMTLKQAKEWIDNYEEQ